jgi:hypothetical protein
MSLNGLRSIPRLPSIRARKPAHGEFDSIARKFAPGFNLGHVGRFGEAAKHFTCFLTRFLSRQCEGLAPEGVARPHNDQMMTRKAMKAMRATARLS